MMTRRPAPSLPDFLARALPFERYCVDVDRHQVHVIEHGEGRPVLMLHGNPTWSFLYRNIVRALVGAPVRCIAPDLIGLGLSDRPKAADAHTLDNHARWLGELVDGMGLDGVILVVQDWGGPIGLRTFADRRDRLAGLVVLNTVVAPPRPGFRPTAFHRFARVPLASTIAFRLLGFPQNALWAAQGDRQSISGDTARAYRYPLRRLRDNAAPLALARMVPDSLSHPSVAPLALCRDLFVSFDGPMECVWGDRDPVLGRARRYLKKLRPDLPIVRTPAGHFLQEEVPKEIAAAVRRVLERIG